MVEYVGLTQLAIVFRVFVQLGVVQNRVQIQHSQPFVYQLRNTQWDIAEGMF